MVEHILCSTIFCTYVNLSCNNKFEIFCLLLQYAYFVLTKIYLKWWRALVEHNLCSTKKTHRTIRADKSIINDFGDRAQFVFYQETYVEQYVAT